MGVREQLKNGKNRRIAMVIMTMFVLFMEISSWVISEWKYYGIYYNSVDRDGNKISLQVIVNAGRFSFNRVVYPVTKQSFYTFDQESVNPLGFSCGMYDAIDAWTYHIYEQPKYGGFVYYGFQVLRVPDPLMQYMGVRIPCYAVTAVLAFVTLLSLIPYYRYRRIDQYRKEGRCVKCGYLLTGNMSGRCPECGTEIAHQIAKK